MHIISLLAVLFVFLSAFLLMASTERHVSPFIYLISSTFSVFIFAVRAVATATDELMDEKMNLFP